MLQNILDEVIDGEPRYNIKKNNGETIENNVDIELATPVVQEGTPINRALFRNLQGDLYTVSSANTTTVTKTEVDGKHVYNPLPTTWTQVTQYTHYTQDGYEISASGYDEPSGESYRSVVNAFDGATTTHYNAPAGVTYNSVTIKFPNAVTLLKVRINIEYTSGNWYLEGSNSGDSFSAIISSNSTGEVTFNISRAYGAYTYFRIRAKASSASSSWRLKEFEIMEWAGVGLDYVHSINLPLTSYESHKIINVNFSAFSGVALYKSAFLNVNNLGAKEIVGTIDYGIVYTLRYINNQWQIISTSRRFATGSLSITSEQYSAEISLDGAKYVLIDNSKQGGGDSQAGVRLVLPGASAVGTYLGSGVGEDLRAELNEDGTVLKVTNNLSIDMILNYVAFY